MLSFDQIERLLCLLAEWDGDTLISRFLAYRSDFPVDLTGDFLRRQSSDRVRHLFFAVCVQNRRLPEGAEELALAA